MVENLLELCDRGTPLAKLQVCETADVGGVEPVKRATITEVVWQRRFQDLDSGGRVFLMELARCPDRRNEAFLDHRIQREIRRQPVGELRRPRRFPRPRI